MCTCVEEKWLRILCAPWGDDVEALTERVLHEARVFLTPGFIFGNNGKRYIRISLCAKDERIKEALKRIQACTW